MAGAAAVQSSTPSRTLREKNASDPPEWRFAADLLGFLGPLNRWSHAFMFTTTRGELRFLSDPSNIGFIND